MVLRWEARRLTSPRAGRPGFGQDHPRVHAGIRRGVFGNPVGDVKEKDGTHLGLNSGSRMW